MDRRPHILIVEDEPAIARSLERCVAGFGFAVSAVTAFGEEALHLAALHGPDLVLMDIGLGGALDGITAAHEIRSLQIPVVFLTGHTDDEVVRAARGSESYGYVLKPYKARELQIVLEMALYKHHAERERARLEDQVRRSEKLDAL